MTSLLDFLVAAIFLSTFPTVRYTQDRRESDGYRYTEYCVGLYQQTSTWACLEVHR